jgi:hypothetical protein
MSFASLQVLGDLLGYHYDALISLPDASWMLVMRDSMDAEIVFVAESPEAAVTKAIARISLLVEGRPE